MYWLQTEINSDKYLGQKIEDVIKRLGGTTDFDVYLTVYDRRYHEDWPIFQEYFSKEDLEKGVLVRHTVKKFMLSKLHLWSKKENEGWVIFYSIRYSNWVTF